MSQDSNSGRPKRARCRRAVHKAIATVCHHLFTLKLELTFFLPYNGSQWAPNCLVTNILQNICVPQKKLSHTVTFDFEMMIEFSFFSIPLKLK